MRERLARFFGPSTRFSVLNEPLGSVELRGAASRVVILPALGGKISVMELGGRDWLWLNDVIPFTLPTDGASYAETADSGGYDECFPTAVACTLAADVERYGGLALPDHGELWSQTASLTIETRDAGGDGPSIPTAMCEWQGHRMPYHFEREVSIESDGAVRMRYGVTNAGASRLPFIWSAHPLIALTPDTQIVLPDGAPTRVYSQHHIDIFGAGAEHRWPRMRTPAGPEINLARPDAAAKRYACKVFLDMPEGRASIRQDGAELECTWDVSEVPNFGLWINRGGWTPFRRRRAYMNLAFGPCIGAPDSLSDALGDWRAAHWLEVGETRRWELVWRGRRLGPDLASDD